MASERQIAANRNNAKKSTGPKSAAGKKRSSHNSYAHGLSSVLPWTGEWGREIGKLAQTISGDNADLLELARASAVAESKLLLSKIDRAKDQMIRRVLAQGCVDKPPKIYSEIKESDDGCILVTELPGIRIPKSARFYPRLSQQEPDRTAQAMYRALPVLLQFDRYERRAAATFHRAMRELILSKGTNDPQPGRSRGDQKQLRKAKEK
jgi:hypothetical protein